MKPFKVQEQYMSDDDSDLGNIIAFPIKDKEGGKKKVVKESPEEPPASEELKPVILTRESVERLVKALSTIHMATTYKAGKNEVCKENLLSANFPCKLNCGCYVNICAAMGLESFLGGPSREEAILLVNAEHELMRSIADDLTDGDEEDK